MIAWLATSLSSQLFAQSTISIDIEQPPFQYTETKDSNRVTRLIEEIKAKTVRLNYTSEYGYLESLLKELEIAESSQVLVFSKTSLQVRQISRRNPRAIYFNDDTYVGWVRGSSLMEISTFDPLLGAVFYTVEMHPWQPEVERANYDCLGCHATSMTGGIPGHTVRSVHTDFDGGIAAQKPSFVTSHSSPFHERWGGWYVTGLHGDMKHMGNAFLQGGIMHPSENGNRLSLREDFDTFGYLSPYSDIVALMVLEHQTQMHNRMTKADFTVRHLMHERSTEETQGPPTRQEQELHQEQEQERSLELRGIAKEVVDGLLFRDEAPIVSKIKGSLMFTQDFTRRGPRDDQSRSLRDFDLQTRLFRYPCSYLIYSDAFDNMPESLRLEVYRQLERVLTAKDSSGEYVHLESDTRRAVREILIATKDEFRDSLN